MPQHLGPDEIARIRERHASAGELVRVTAHLDACGDCRAALADDAADAALVAELLRGAGDEHVAPETIVAYVDGTLDPIDREIADSHLADCLQCRREVRDLTAFANARRPRQRWVFAAAAAAAILLIGLAYPMFQHVTTPSAPQSAGAISLVDGGRRVELTHDGRVVGLDVSGDAAARIAAALRNGALAEPQRAAALRHETESLRGLATPGTLAPVAPIGCVVVTQRPTFEWTAVPGARYKVEVFGDNFRPVAQSEVLETNRWTVPQQLAHGETYAWQVTAYTRNGDATTSPAPPAPEARFAVIDAEQATKIDWLQQMQPRSHLALGVAYAEAGAAVEAERELLALNAENHGAEPAARLLRTVRARR